jgi:anthranilate synthase component 1
VFDPAYVLTAVALHGEEKEELTVIDRLNSTGTSRLEVADPLVALEQIIGSYRIHNGNEFSSNASLYRFSGGALGYVSYDYANHWMKVRSNRDNMSEGVNSRPLSSSLIFPDIQFGLYEEGIIFDHRLKKAYYFFSDKTKDRSREVEEICNNKSDAKIDKVSFGLDGRRSFAFSKPEANISKEEFEDSVSRAKEYIRKGDIFQAVLSKKYKFKIAGDALEFYSKLHNINPSPYMYFLDMNDTKIVGSSPEMLARVDQGIVETFPIAGTRPVSHDESENQRLANELLLDEKERAEHLMLVDLARNDIGRVSEFGSVSLDDEFMKIHRYSHVQHIVSHVKGTLRRKLTSFDAFRSLFPAGTVSGAPKIRAMQIIEELEPESRGPYAGAVGYFSFFNGNMDFAIAIRTLIAKENEAYIQAGAGIVADSDPESEWFETERKTLGLIRALELSAPSDKGGII